MSTSEKIKRKSDYNKNHKRRRYHADPEFKAKILAENKAYRQADPARAAQRRRDHKLKTKYGMTQDDYRILFEAQDGKCYLCRRPSHNKRNLHIDHCHKTGMVRGLLCMYCNHALGVVEGRKWNLSTLYLLLGSKSKPGIGTALVSSAPVFVWNPNASVAP